MKNCVGNATHTHTPVSEILFTHKVALCLSINKKFPYTRYGKKSLKSLNSVFKGSIASILSSLTEVLIVYLNLYSAGGV